MSYKILPKNLTEEEYNDIINANTCEELKSLKTLIISLITSNNFESKSNTINIRILSSNEWEKYIRESNLDGSITANNINVWNYQAAISDVNEGGGMNNTHRADIDFLKDLTSSNSSDLAVSKTIKTFNIHLSGRTSGNQSLHQYYTVPADLSFNKSTNLYHFYFSAGYGASTTNHNFIWCNMYYTMCFRPVFQYIDNKKSINMYK